MSNLERFKRSLHQRERCAHAPLEIPPCPSFAKPAMYKPTAKYVAGQTVLHSSFGQGVVIEAWDQKIAVYFESCGIINLIAKGIEGPPPITQTPAVPKQTKKLTKPKPRKPRAPKNPRPKTNPALSKTVAELKEKNRKNSSTDICPNCGHVLGGQLHQMTCGEKKIWEP